MMNKKTALIWLFVITCVAAVIVRHDLHPMLRIMVAGSFGIIACIAVVIIWAICTFICRASSLAAYTVKNKTGDTILCHTIDNTCYAVAEQEADSGNVDSGLWSKALVNARGNEDKRKVEYIKLRAKEIHKQKIVEVRQQVESIQQKITVVPQIQVRPEQYYAKAMQEIKSGTPDKDIWGEAILKAYETGVYENKHHSQKDKYIESVYIELRVKQLKKLES